MRSAGSVKYYLSFPPSPSQHSRQPYSVMCSSEPEADVLLFMDFSLFSTRLQIFCGQWSCLSIYKSGRNAWYMVGPQEMFEE